MAIASLIVQSLVVIGFVFAIRQLKLNQKQLYLETIRYCVAKFQKLDIHKQSKKSDLKKYIDLCNEELFYIKNDYLPDVVAYEWLDGLMDYMPIIAEGKVVNMAHLANSKLVALQPYIKQYYPRVYNTFLVHTDFDWCNVYGSERTDKAIYKERKAVITALMQNLKQYKEY